MKKILNIQKSLISFLLFVGIFAVFFSNNSNIDIALATENATINNDNSTWVSNLQFGQPIYTEHYFVKSNNSEQLQQKQESQVRNENSTQIPEESFSGNGTLFGTDVVIATGNYSFTPRGNNTVLIEGNAQLTTKDGNMTDLAPYVFQSIGQYNEDGSFNNKGVAIFDANATGKLSILSNIVGIFKSQTDSSGNGTFIMWKLE